MYAIRHKRLDLFFNGAKTGYAPDGINIWHQCGRRYDLLEHAQSAVDGAIAARLFTRRDAVRNVEVVEVQERITKHYPIGDRTQAGLRAEG